MGLSSHCPCRAALLLLLLFSTLAINRVDATASREHHGAPRTAEPAEHGKDGAAAPLLPRLSAPPEEDGESLLFDGYTTLLDEYSPSIVSQREKQRAPPPPKGNEGYSFPYRPKFPSSVHLGMCSLADFKYGHDSMLGEGGFGQVFLASHKSTGIEVAIKRISAESIREKPKHVENEETIHRILECPYIGRLYCTMTNAAHDVFLVLEYFPGGNLTRRLRAHHPLSRHLLVKFIAQIVLALRYLHERCIIYRDLKAENVMIDPADNVKLIDFGLSAYDCTNELTSLAGTIEYVAPEVAIRSPYGRAADYYSLAVLSYLLRMNALPYRRNKLERSEFARRLHSGEIGIPLIGDSDLDQVIAILGDRDATNRWRRVHDDFEKFKALPLFATFDWDYYERPHTFMLR